MTTHEERIAELEKVLDAQRVEVDALRSGNRAFRRVVVVVGVLVAVGFYSALRSDAQTPAPAKPAEAKPATSEVKPPAPAPAKTTSAPKVVQAQRFELVDSTGRVLAVLGLEEKSSVLELRNADAKRIARIEGWTNGDGALTTFNRVGDVLVHIGATQKRDGKISTFADTGQELVQISVNQDGAGSIGNFNANGHRMAVMTGTPEGGFVGTFDMAGMCVVKMGVKEKGAGVVEALGSEGNYEALDPDGALDKSGEQ